VKKFCGPILWLQKKAAQLVKQRTIWLGLVGTGEPVTVTESVSSNPGAKKTKQHELLLLG